VGLYSALLEESAAVVLITLEAHRKMVDMKNHSTHNRIHITDVETYNDTGLKLVDYPEFIAIMAKTHTVVIDFEDCPDVRPDLHVNRIASSIRRHAKRLDIPVTIQTPGRTRRITVRAMTQNEIYMNQNTTAKANRTRRWGTK